MAALDETTTHWFPEVTMGGVDVSDDLKGHLAVKRVESGATIATFTMLPAAGPLDPTAWQGAAVAIDFVLTDGPAGPELGRWTAFSGRVEQSTYRPRTRAVEFRCTDGLQEVLDGTTVAALDTLIGGHHSTDVFVDAASNYEYAQQRMETVAASLELDPAGALRLTPWAAGAVAITFTDADIRDAADLVPTLASRDQLTNEVVIQFDYRYENTRHRETSWTWSYGRGLCDYLTLSSTLPTQDMARTAAGATGWAIKGESYDHLWETGVYHCGTPPDDVDVAWVNNQPQLIIGAAFTFANQWTQTITEEYTLTVTAPESSAVVGTITKELRSSALVRFDWEQYETGPDPAATADGCGAQANEKNTVLFSSSAGGVDTYTGADGRFDPPAGSVQDAWGDWVLDQGDEARRTAAINTELARANVRILDSHRQNRVSFTTMSMRPDLDLIHTIHVNADRAQATGKTIELEHVMDIDTGDHETRFVIAVSRRYGTDTPPAADPLTPPAQPDTTPPVASSQPFNTAGTTTQLGGDTGAPAHDPCRDGYSGNYMNVPGESVISGIDENGDSVFVNPVEATAPPDPGAPLYPIHMRVTLDAIEADVRDPITAAAAAAYTVTIPNDELVLSA